MRIPVTIYKLAVSEDIMGGLMDHDENHGVWMVTAGGQQTG
jgi:hypothetical protein